MNARNAKITRLPRDVRKELNERLVRCQESPQRLDSLIALNQVHHTSRE